MPNKEEKKQKESDLLNVGIAGASHETIQRFGDAAKQHYVAYSGVDNEMGTVAKGLKQIAAEKINPNFEFQNVHQQAGFSAEIKDSARRNADSIIKGDSTRKVRTDDLGRVNDPLYDTVVVDTEGNMIAGSGAQMKFLGASKKDPSGAGNASRALEKLQSKKFQKYLDNNAKIDVPSDQYDQMIEEANLKIERLAKQLENQKKISGSEQTCKIQEKINKLEKIKKSLRKSTVSGDEAVFARLHPGASTYIDIAKNSHKAGAQTAKIAAIIGGSVSILKNVVSVAKGEIEVQDALRNVAKDTTETTAVGYGIGAVGSAIKGAMQNAKLQNIQALSETNIVGTMVAVSVAAKKTLTRYFRGEIDGVECLEALGEQGTGMVSSAMFTAIGQVAIPIPVVGGLIGSMLGYSISSATYGIMMQSLKEPKLAHEERLQIERACEEYVKMIREYRVELEKLISEYLVDQMEVFRESFAGIKNALAIGDVDWVIESANAITETFGGTPSFGNFNEFNSMIIEGSKFSL